MCDNLLQEPVAFEDFQFTLSIEPNLMPDFDLPEFEMPSENNTVLDEKDQQMFAQFLDQLYADLTCVDDVCYLSESLEGLSGQDFLKEPVEASNTS
ncbi:hypothetical protein BY458DRAFT_511328 [Sporodiniella umbellata]|nr:hypothetical protein BY458DRAFT_511328 [Sporodiniella umbellata]